MLLRERCQRQNQLGEHSAAEWIRSRWERGTSLRRELHQLLGRPRVERSGQPRLGQPSRFAEGSSVRVREAVAVQATLDDKSRLRGLVWIPQQWGYCGRVLRVTRVMRRLLDDRGRLRPVSGTVLLEGATCAGLDGSAGCGRSCPLLFRDEWLEPAAGPAEQEPPAAAHGAPHAAPATDDASAVRWARVRAADEIAATLDITGRHGGLRFMPEMYRFAGQRRRVERRLAQVFESDRYLPPAERFYLLEGLHCGGEILGDDGPCDRACALLWHADWLELE